ncbi:hypothetical protein [Streptomyces atratus]|uniref:hypothetical protein n=1 Tax=Streptomyces atratus TaxID=1893 RepID=UPI001E2B5C58|nr:hypothetical protein [Streptomyces atratus]
MPTHYDSLPDIAVGRHPDYGIVAANPKQLAASTRMLKGFDFHPVPDQLTLYALADQQRDGQGRTTRAVALLHKAGYQVDVDAAFDPSLASGATPARDRPPRIDPDVAFAEHPQLGCVAATSDQSSALGGRLILEEHSWRLNPNLDIYTLPITTDRSEALEKVASATVSMHRSNPPGRGAAPPRPGRSSTPPSCTRDGRTQRAQPGLHRPQVPHKRRSARRQPSPRRPPGQSAGSRSRRLRSGGPADRPAHRVLPQPLTQLQ